MAGPNTPKALARALRAGDRRALAQAITLVESQRPEDWQPADTLLEEILPSAGKARRIGITGVPGVGKSTFIEELGYRLTERGHRLAVLAIDPSSSLSGGSILGDKTRMERLASHPAAFIRPSPTAGTLGGVARRSREALLLCEAAGYDLVMVETVGVGQSEFEVRQLVDCLVLLMLPGAGDELQGIKRGLSELADVLLVHKADGEGVEAAKASALELQGAIDLLGQREGVAREVATCSSRSGAGIDEVWGRIEGSLAAAESDGRLADRRREQNLHWFDAAVRELLQERLLGRAEVAVEHARLRNEVEAGRLHASEAARRLVERVLAR